MREWVGERWWGGRGGRREFIIPGDGEVGGVNFLESEVMKLWGGTRGRDEVSLECSINVSRIHE